MIAMLAGLIAQAVLLLTLAPLLVGLVARIADAWPWGTRGHAGGRSASGILDEWYDLIGWLKRGSDRHLSGAGAIAPAFALGATLTAGALTPTLVRQAPLADSGDLVALLALLALGRGARAYSTLELAAQPASRLRTGHDLAVGALREPILLLSLLAVAIIAHQTGVPALALADTGVPGPSRGFAFLAAALIALLEARQLPPPRPVSTTGFSLPRFDVSSDPEAKGRDRALLRWALVVRYLVILSVMVAAFLPWGLGSAGDDTLPRLALGAALYLVKVLALGIALRLLDVAVSAVFRPPSENEVLGGGLLCAILALILGGVTHA